MEKSIIRFSMSFYFDVYKHLDINEDTLWKSLKFENICFDDRKTIMNKVRELKELRKSLNNSPKHEVEEQAEQLGLLTIQGERQMRLAF